MAIHDPHSFPGRLIVVEGIDGSGKSTQLSLLQTFLVSEGYDVSFTEWNSSPIVKDTTKRGKKKNLFSPTTFSLIHATDFADRHERSILPPLQAGLIVLADRYAYTAFARDAARGCDPAWIRNLYDFATRPDLSLYFKVDIDTAVARITGGRIQLKFHEAGMDLGLSPDPITSFRVFQKPGAGGVRPRGGRVRTDGARREPFGGGAAAGDAQARQAHPQGPAPHPRAARGAGQRLPARDGHTVRE